MSLWARLAILCLAVAMVPAAAEEEKIVEKSTGVAFPKVRSLGGSTFSLAFTGRVRFTLFRESEKKILVMHMVRNVDKEDMEEIFSEYLAGLPDDEDNAQDKRRLLKAMPRTRKGDELDFVWLPESLAFLVGGEEKAEFRNPALATALWSALLE